VFFSVLARGPGVKAIDRLLEISGKGSVGSIRTLFSPRGRLVSRDVPGLGALGTFETEIRPFGGARGGCAPGRHLAPGRWRAERFSATSDGWRRWTAQLTHARRRVRVAVGAVVTVFAGRRSLARFLSPVRRARTPHSCATRECSTCEFIVRANSGTPRRGGT